MPSPQLQVPSTSLFCPGTGHGAGTTSRKKGLSAYSSPFTYTCRGAMP